MKTKPYVLSLLLALTLLASGCIAYEPESGNDADQETSGGAGHDDEEGFNDPDDQMTHTACAADEETISNVVGGTESTDKTFGVPEGCTRVELTGSWSIGGTASFGLTDPDGTGVWSKASSGGETHPPGELFSSADAEDGDWVLSIDISGGGNYRFTLAWA